MRFVFCGIGVLDGAVQVEEARADDITIVCDEELEDLDEEAEWARLHHVASVRSKGPTTKYARKAPLRV